MVSPSGGVGRSAHQMTSHPIIDLFIGVPAALPTQGNWTMPHAHVPEFVAIWRRGLSRRTSGRWDLLVVTDVSSGELGVSMVSLHSCPYLPYPSLVTRFAPVEHLGSWHRDGLVWLLCSQKGRLRSACFRLWPLQFNRPRVNGKTHFCLSTISSEHGSLTHTYEQRWEE